MDAFFHAMRGVIHGLMAREAMRILDHGEEPTCPFEACATDMCFLWHSIDKHYEGLRYVWLPTSGILPDDMPEDGVDGYVELDQSRRRKGGRAGRMVRLEREFGGHKLH